MAVSCGTPTNHLLMARVGKRGTEKHTMNTNIDEGGTTVAELIDAVVQQTPEKLAVSGPDGSVTYGELAARADLVAQELRGLGVAPGDLVGLVVGRSVSLVVAALAIFRAGAAYVAIDPDYPDDRLGFMLDDSAPAAVIADGASAARLVGAGPTVVLSAAGEIAGAATEAPTAPAAPAPDDVAYVVYTSGSSGRPKGAVIEHGSLLGLVEWHRRAFELTAEDQTTQIASPGFDAAVWEIWPTLAGGATLHVVPEALRTDPVGLRDWLVATGITVTFLPTAVAEGILALNWPDTGALRIMLTGGDALTRRPAAGLGFTLVNNYGLSEATVVATSGVVEAEGEGSPSIGRAIDGMSVEIVDADLAPVPAGEPGELIVRGPLVGRGYLNQPTMTAERFVTDERGRLYRTGDRARIDADGEIEFLGRLDDQLSIRGFRVEPGEIATVLNGHPGVEASVAAAAGASSAETQLVAYVVAAGAERPAEAELSELLGASLPDYMVPSRYVWLDALPVTAHGKVDRKALPAVVDEQPAEPVGRAPETETEATIAQIVAELLEVPQVGVDQNFFLLGGHSMLGAQLIVRLEDAFDVEVSLRFLFDHPTPAELAAEIDAQVEADAAVPA
jgi:amino acid adenylation domain-containing protein